MNQCIDLTGPKSVARVTLGTMSATGKEAVEAAIGKTLKGQINKAVKYSTWIHEQFESFGWMYEPQAPQGTSTSIITPCHSL